MGKTKTGISMIVTGGPESTYLNSPLRSKLWRHADRLGVSRNSIVKRGIEMIIKQLDQEELDAISARGGSAGERLPKHTR